MNEAQIVHARALRDSGQSYRQIGMMFGLNESTVRRALKKTPPPKKRRVTFIIIEEEV